MNKELTYRTKSVAHKPQKQFDVKAQMAKSQNSNNENKDLEVKSKKVLQTQKSIINNECHKSFETEDKFVCVKIKGESSIADGTLSIGDVISQKYKNIRGIVGTAKNFVFNKPSIKEASISIKYDAKDLKNIKEDDLGLFYIDTRNNKIIPIKNNLTFDKKNKIITATVDHFSVYAIGDTKILGQFSIEGSLDKTSIIFAVENSKKVKSEKKLILAQAFIKKFCHELVNINKNASEDNNTRYGILTFSDTSNVLTLPTTDVNNLFSTITKIKPKFPILFLTYRRFNPKHFKNHFLFFC